MNLFRSLHVNKPSTRRAYPSGFYSPSNSFPYPIPGSARRCKCFRHPFGRHTCFKWSSHIAKSVSSGEIKPEKTNLNYGSKTRRKPLVNCTVNLPIATYLSRFATSLYGAYPWIAKGSVQSSSNSGGGEVEKSSRMTCVQRRKERTARR